MRDRFCVSAVVLALAAMALALLAAPAGAATLDDARKRGAIICGVSEGLLGFSQKGGNGKWSGFDVDFCRAVAAALFADPEKVRYVPLSAEARFEALSSGKIDLLSRNTTWTLSRDARRGLEFVGVTYYDGQGFMLRLDNGLTSALQLGGASICVLSGTTSEANLERFFAVRDIPYTVLTFDRRDDVLAAYEARRCDAYSADRSALASQRLQLKFPDEHTILPEVVSKEPLGPVVREGDAAWADLVQWVLFLLINAEEAGWSSTAKPADMKPAVKALIAAAGTSAAGLGLDKAWAQTVIAKVGNYGEIFQRNIGADSPLEIGRGVNALWTKGGILYAPPMR